MLAYTHSSAAHAVHSTTHTSWLRSDHYNGPTPAKHQNGGFFTVSRWVNFHKIYTQQVQRIIGDKQPLLCLWTCIMTLSDMTLMTIVDIFSYIMFHCTPLTRVNVWSIPDGHGHHVTYEAQLHDIFLGAPTGETLHHW